MDLLLVTVTRQPKYINKIMIYLISKRQLFHKWLIAMETYHLRSHCKQRLAP